ncbi:response regulator [Qipengyuania sp. RANM35]|uniref:response regulator n=1 Tax=Qipengyuania sp. RANM35 TaxID=3068635 RepID=UPI0034DAEEB6
MDRPTSILLVDDEPLILMDLEFAAEDEGLHPYCAATIATALEHIESGIDCAVLDVSLQDGENCLPIALELDKRGIPYVIHSGDLDRQNETIRSLNAYRIAKPACSRKVVGAAIEAYSQTRGGMLAAAE